MPGTFGTKFADPSPGRDGSSTTALSMSGTDVAIGVGNTSPYVNAFPWTTSGWGTKYSNPGTLPPVQLTSIGFSNAGTDIAMTLTNTSPYVHVYPWTPGTGFGTKYANPGTLPSQGKGVKFRPGDSVIAIAVGVTTGPFIQAWPWTPGTGFGAKYADPGSTTVGSASNGTNIGWSKTGNTIFVSFTGSGAGLGKCISAYPWSAGFGTQYTDPTVHSASVHGTKIDVTPASDAVVFGKSLSTTNGLTGFPFVEGTGWGTEYATKHFTSDFFAGGSPSPGNNFGDVKFSPDGLILFVTYTALVGIGPTAILFNSTTGFGNIYGPALGTDSGLVDAKQVDISAAFKYFVVGSALTAQGGITAWPFGDVFTPPAPDNSWPCNVTNPIFFGATSDVNGNVFVFGDKVCRDASTRYGGYKAPRILDISSINRVASDFLTGGWPAQSASMKIADPDYVFRNLANQPSLINRTAWIFAYSEAIRAAGGNPTLLFHGPIQSDPFTDNLTYTLNINDYIGSQYGLLKPDLMIPQRTTDTTHFAGCPNRSLNKGEPIIGGTITKTGGALKGINVGIITVGGTNYVCALVAGHACAGGIINAYDKNGTALVWGTNAWAPGKTGWTTIQAGGQLYWDIGDRRYTLIFILASSALGVDFIAGTTDIYINTNGLEPNGDGTGTVITDLLTLYKYLMVQFITQSYLKGAYLPGLQFQFFPGSVEVRDVIDETSFTAASTQSAVYLGGGFIGGFVIGAQGRRQSVRDILQGANTSCNVFMGVNANSQLFVKMFNFDRATLLGSTRTITARRDILSQPRFTIVPKWEWFTNDMAYQYAANYRDDNTGLWDGFNITGNAPSVIKYGNVPGSRQYPLIQDTATANAVAGRQMAFCSPDPPRIATWAQSLCGMSFDILSAAPMTCYPGRGAAGWVDNAVFIIGQSLGPKGRKTTFTGVDVNAIVT